MNRDHDDLAPDTLAIHADRDLNETHAVTPPIWQTSTFWAESGAEFLDMATAPRHDRFYTRYGNPTSTQVEAVIMRGLAKQPADRYPDVLSFATELRKALLATASEDSGFLAKMKGLFRQK